MQQPKIELGEKIETIVLSRASGAFGEWLDDIELDNGTVVSICSVDGVQFCVYRHNSCDVREGKSPCWSVLRMYDARCAFGSGKYDLARITEGDFK